MYCTVGGVLVMMMEMLVLWRLQVITSEYHEHFL